MKYILSLIILLFCIKGFSQEPKKQESILYIVDNLPIIDDPDESNGTLTNDDIDHLNVLTNPEKIRELGYNNVDKIIYIFTKEYEKRSDDLKKIPSTKTMEKKDGLWYLKDSPTPYSGKFIDYFINGKIQGEGFLHDGLVNGTRTVYFKNGQKSYFRNYINGVTNGYSEEYFIDGKLKQKGSFKNGKDEGVWIDYYSTGKIKRQTNFVNLMPVMTKEEKKFYDLQSRALELMSSEDYNTALKKLNEAEKLNPSYADIYFYKGTSELDVLNFDAAIIDFDKAIELEPLYMEALANRAFARIRKYEFKNGRALMNTHEVKVLAVKDKVEIPQDEKEKICSDLNRSVSLGDAKELILDALKKYCSNP
jgi:antitoxin component YwqK of YwqJK toxin-antitoxin module